MDERKHTDKAIYWRSMLPKNKWTDPRFLWAWHSSALACLLVVNNSTFYIEKVWPVSVCGKWSSSRFSFHQTKNNWKWKHNCLEISFLHFVIFMKILMSRSDCLNRALNLDRLWTMLRILFEFLHLKTFYFTSVIFGPPSSDYSYGLPSLIS